MKDKVTVDQATEALKNIQASQETVLRDTIYPQWWSVLVSITAFMFVAHRLFEAPALTAYSNVMLVAVLTTILALAICILWLKKTRRVISVNLFVITQFAIIYTGIVSRWIMRTYSLYWIPLIAGLVAAAAVYLVFEWRRNTLIKKCGPS